jgi:hypothetical protein
MAWHGISDSHLLELSPFPFPFAFPTLLGTSAKATAVCLFLGFFSFLFPFAKTFWIALWRCEDDKRYECMKVYRQIHTRNQHAFKMKRPDSLLRCEMVRYIRPQVKGHVSTSH